MKQTITYKNTQPQRIDKYIHSLHSDFSRRFFQNAIKNGDILVNGKKVSPSYKLKENDKIKIDIKKVPEIDFEIKPEKNISFEVLFEHPDFLIIDKPSGISVHPSENEKSGTLVNGLLEKFPEIKKIGENKLRPGIVHRLDKETSGVLVVVKNQKAFEYFKNLFQNRKIEKTYLAWVWGCLKEKEEKISNFIGRSKSNPIKQSVSQNSQRLSNPKEALSHYKVISEKQDKSLVEVKPKTGRKHQIRVQFHSIGHPVLGDKKYFNKKIKVLNRSFSRHLLHAYKIKFKYSDGKSYEFESNLPEDFNI